MPIEAMFDKTAAVKRLSDLGNGTQGYTTHITSMDCHVQPLDDAYNEDIRGNFGKDWMMFCTVQDILEADVVVVDGINYRVVGVESFAFMGSDRHMEVRIRRANDEENLGQ